MTRALTNAKNSERSLSQTQALFFKAYEKTREIMRSCKKAGISYAIYESWKKNPEFLQKMQEYEKENQQLYHDTMVRLALFGETTKKKRMGSFLPKLREIQKKESQDLMLLSDSELLSLLS